jgi:FG-GAP-like repeat/Bacterial Ig-like domain (group 3)
MPRHLRISFLLILLVMPAALNAQNRLALAPLYPLGGTVFSAVTSDFNGDGRSDLLAYVKPSSGVATPWGVTLTLGNANGTYGTPKLIASFPASTTGYVAAGDFNGDGKIDFAVALSSRSIRVYLGNGDGTFRAAASLNSTGGNPLSFLAGKITNSTHSDLILGLQANDSTGLVYVYPGNGNGTFAARKVTGTGTVLPSIMTLGDANRDAKVDVALSDRNTSYQMLLGRGDGTFIAKQFVSLNTYGNFGALMLTDYNGDGIPDLIVANEGNYLGYSGTGEIPSLYVLSGYGDGTFNNAGTYADAGNSGWGLALGDMNGDGRADLVVYNMLSSDVAVKMRSATAGLTPAPAERYAVADSYRAFIALLTGDVNGDGKRDVLVVSVFGVQVLLGIGGGQLRAPAATELQSYSADLKSTDLNHDGNADLVIRGYDVSNSQTGYIETDHLYLALGNKTQTLTRKPSIFSASSPDFGPLGLGNFNTDGNLDILIRQGVLFNNGSAQFTGPHSEPSNIGEVYATSADYNTAVGDLNGDGKADLVSAGATTLTVSLGNGDGTFKPDVNYSLGGTGANAVVLRDINGDGKLDAITANYASWSVSVFLGNGNGTFRPAREFTVGYPNQPVTLAVGDFNRDGKLDIAVAGYAAISILLGDGTGGFTNGTTFTVDSTRIEGIAAVSLRSNALMDLIVVDSAYRTVRLFYGNGNGTFGPAIVYPVGQRPTSIVTGDFNGDGSQDVAVALDFSSALPVFYNQGGNYLTLTASNTNPASGELVTFTATVTASQPGNGTPGGTLSFKEGNTTYAMSVYAGGSISWGAPSLSKGKHTISAVYSGNSTFNPHTSSVTITVH